MRSLEKTMKKDVGGITYYRDSRDHDCTLDVPYKGDVENTILDIFRD